MQVQLISVTKPCDSEINPEQLMGYCARVSSPNQNDTSTASRLLEYCIKRGHWSVFEMADMTVEIETSRAISAQILRHRSFSFQEFSQRYAQTTSFETYPARRQDVKNRQNSIDNLPDIEKAWFLGAQKEMQSLANGYYNEALEKGIAKECARFLLPMSASTKLYMKGSVRSWIHYLQVRSHSSTQQEHREIAEEIRKIFESQFPYIYNAVFGEL